MRRREFLKGLAATGSALMLPSAQLLSGQRRSSNCGPQGEGPGGIKVLFFGLWAFHLDGSNQDPNKKMHAFTPAAPALGHTFCANLWAGGAVQNAQSLSDLSSLTIDQRGNTSVQALISILRCRNAGILIHSERVNLDRSRCKCIDMPLPDDIVPLLTVATMEQFACGGDLSSSGCAEALANYPGIFVLRYLSATSAALTSGSKAINADGSGNLELHTSPPDGATHLAQHAKMAYGELMTHIINSDTGKPLAINFQAVTPDGINSDYLYDADILPAEVTNRHLVDCSLPTKAKAAQPLRTLPALQPANCGGGNGTVIYP